MAEKKPKVGLPEGMNFGVDFGGVTSDVADLGDFIDEFEAPPRTARPEKSPTSSGGGGVESATAKVEATPTPAAVTEEKVVELSPPPRKKAQPAKKRSKPEQSESSASQPSAPAAPRRRPPRKEIGLDAETMAMLSELRRDAQEQSGEETLSNSEVVRAAIRAVREARNHIEYQRCGRRGHWGSASQRALLDNLTDAYMRAVGKLQSERSAE